jgi:hypothetical protein
MGRLCIEGRPHKHLGSRRDFLVGTAATGVTPRVSIYSRRALLPRTPRQLTAAGWGGATSFAAGR